MKLKSFYILAFCLFIIGCTDKTKQGDSPAEDAKAKELFQGLWVSDDNGEPALLAKGDSVFYPDSACMPMQFWIYKDSLYLKGQNQNEYKIAKQSENVFVFINDNGDEVRLVKSKNKDLRASFSYQVYALNTFMHAQTDTVVRTSMGYFESKITVKTTSDRVIKSTYNENGIEVEFASLIDKKFLEKSILRKFEFNHTDEKALYFDAIIGIPDASTSYVIAIRITTDGNLSMKMR